MKSTITLYYKSLVQEGRNFCLHVNDVNNIDDYLDEVLTDSIEIEGFQYIKHDLVVSIKINASQVNLEYGNDDKDLNYCKIVNTDDDGDNPETPMYYFVSKKNWKSQSTIELVLHMDTINSFRYMTDYVISPKSLIKRMHKDRFTKLTGNRTCKISLTAKAKSVTTGKYVDLVVGCSDGTIISATFDSTYPDLSINSCQFVYDSTYGYYFIRVRVGNTSFVDQDCSITIVYTSKALVRVIDTKSEDINVPKFKLKESGIVDSKDNGINWALYYKNSDNQIDTSPVDCFLIPDQAINISYKALDGKITTADVTTGKWLYICPNFTYQPTTFKINDAWASTGIEEITDYRKIYYGVAIHNNSGTLELYTIRLDYRIGPQSGITYEYVKIASASEVDVVNPPDNIYGRTESAQVTDSEDLYELLKSYNAPTTIAMPTSTQVTLLNKASIDKTLSENIKLINIPFSPTPYERDASNNIILNECWDYDVGEEMLKLTDLSTRFKNQITTSSKSILADYLYYQEPDVTDYRYVDDSKLFNSDFYQIKFVYDSFSRTFNLEAIEFLSSLFNNPEYNLKFDFIMSRNLVSKFLFKFNFTYKLSTEDYDNIIYVARNNEEVLYSSQYLNYVRTGYNYDIKAKERQEEAYKTGLLVSGGTMLGSALLGVATGNPLALATGALGGVSFVGQMLSYARNQAQAEENIQRKLDETRRQAVSVLNADDYDLMYEYTSNKPKLCYYSVSERMRKVLNDLFYYCGYTINEQRLPDVSSRYWFNFVQADLVITETANLSSDIEEDIKEKFSQGVTFLHMHRDEDDNPEWDFDQEKENWENSLL